MYTYESVQAAIIQKLKADTGVTSLVTGTEIREAFWQSRDFNYPNLRIQVLNDLPIGANPCRNENGEVSFTVYSYTTEDSSLQCLRVMQKVKEALSGGFLLSSSFRSGEIRRVRDILPIREQSRVWRAQTLFVVNIFK